MLQQTYMFSITLVLLLGNACALYNDKSEPDTYFANVNVTVCSKDGCRSDINEASYGSSSSHRKVEGHLVHASTDGCKKFVFPVMKSPWIALIQRGSCFFTWKIRNAQQHNASGVIIYGDKPGNSFTMEHKNADVVAVSITHGFGNEIISEMNNSSVYVTITYSRTQEGRKINTISVLFVSVSFIVLMVISLAWLVFYYVQRFRFLYARDKTERRLTTAAKKAIAKLHSRTVSKKEEEDGTLNNSCAVCLEEYKSGETLRTLPCNHEFHKHCVDPWLIEHRTCPMCKTNILKELGMLQSEDERLSSQENDVTVSITPSDHNSALHNGGLVEEHGSISRGQLVQATPSQQPCAVTPVETTASCELSYVRTDKTRNTPGAAV
ncbi:RING finger protein 150-like [Dendronephthya gigantea]|uniref:RING finger protein 150-like n=1 Tax=Dendronephthya gigantea TaxID=151771 RepID=UPI00106A5281|nr:RING finger protein 150-like [Dendronephthya gigantea]